MMMQKPPFLYRKLSSLLKNYEQDARRMNREYIINREQMKQIICSRFRVKSSEMPKIIKEMDGYRQVRRKSQRRVGIL